MITRNRENTQSAMDQQQRLHRVGRGRKRQEADRAYCSFDDAPPRGGAIGEEAKCFVAAVGIGILEADGREWSAVLVDRRLVRAQSPVDAVAHDPVDLPTANCRSRLK